MLELAECNRRRPAHLARHFAEVNSLVPLPWSERPIKKGRPALLRKNEPLARKTVDFIFPVTEPNGTGSDHCLTPPVSD